MDSSAASVPDVSAKRDLILFAQEVACLQRPLFTLAWAASLQAAWYWLSFTDKTLLATCCTVGFVVLAVDFGSFLFLRNSKKKTIIPELLPETIQREQGLQTTSTVAFLDPPRTYSELCALGTDLNSQATRLSNYLSNLREKNRNNFAAAVALTTLVCGSILNQISGSSLSFLLVLVVILLPILERVPQVRKFFSELANALRPLAQSVSSFVDLPPPRAPMPSHEDLARHLEGKLPKMDQPAAPSVTPPIFQDEALKARLAETLSSLPRLPSRRASQNSDGSRPASSSSLPVASMADIALPEQAEEHGAHSAPQPVGSEAVVDVDSVHVEVAHVDLGSKNALRESQMGLRHRGVSNGQDLDDNEGFQLISTNEVEEIEAAEKKE